MLSLGNSSTLAVPEPSLWGRIQRANKASEVLQRLLKSCPLLFSQSFVDKLENFTLKSELRVCDLEFLVEVYKLPIFASASGDKTADESARAAQAVLDEYFSALEKVNGRSYLNVSHRIQTWLSLKLRINDYLQEPTVTVDFNAIEIGGNNQMNNRFALLARASEQQELQRSVAKQFQFGGILEAPLAITSDPIQLVAKAATALNNFLPTNR